MTKRSSTTLLFAFLLFSFQSFSQPATTNRWPKTFLWKITGNGLTKPSYLYGTMHLQDQRLFQFGDSLYSFIEKADGFAMELDMKEAMDSMFTHMMESSEDARFRRMTGLSTKTEVIDSLIERVEQTDDIESRKKLKEIHDARVRKMVKKEMPTIMDMFLFGLAKRQGKWVGGIEDVQDQLQLFDNFGKAISKKDLTASDRDLQTGLEKMINIYIEQDLDKLHKFMTSMDGVSESLDMIKRNKKMALRMDSLARQRSVFFAVGCAHLPGDSGVINLLKKKGFTVEPVFSSKKTDALQYASKLDAFPWEKVTDELQTYTVEMPGAPSDYNMFGELFRTKILFDLNTMTFYMIGSALAQPNVNLDEVVKSIAERSGGSAKDTRHFERNGIKGVQTSVNSEGAFFQVQIMVKDQMIFMLIAGSEKKDDAKNKDYSRFFNSFVAKNKPIIGQEWKLFRNEEMAYTVLMPGQPNRDRKIDLRAIGTQWKFTTYSAIDSANSNYYMVQVRDADAGHYIANDVEFFNSYRDGLSGYFEKITLDTITSWKGFPAYRLEGTVQKTKLRTLNVNRGSRVYTLIATDAVDTSGKRLDRFFDSFVFADYKPVEWKSQAAPFFSTVAPSTFKKTAIDKFDDEYKNRGYETYVAYDANEAISFQVIKTIVNKYFWTKDDSTLMRTSMNTLQNDSIISKRFVHNGNALGFEIISQPSSSNLYKRTRTLVNGDTIYSITAYIPSQYAQLSRYDRFFDEFRFAGETDHSSMFTSKAALLINDLQAEDSLVFQDALSAIDSADFTSGDLPMLLDAMTLQYRDDNNAENYWISTRNCLSRAIQDVADSTLVDGIVTRFPKLKGDKEFIKGDMLDLLVDHKTSESYDAIKKLLLEQTPKVTKSDLSYRITDSLELTARLFPDLLQLSGDSLYGLRVLEIGEELLEKKMLAPEAFAPYKNNILKVANVASKQLQDGTQQGWWFKRFINLLGELKDSDYNNKLRQLLKHKDIEAKYISAIALVKSGESVPASEFLTLATDRSQRRSLYDDLDSLKKLSLFPAKFLSQRSLSESDLFAFPDYDQYPDTLIFLGERIVDIKNQKKRMFLYQVVFKYEGGEKESYLGIAGPYSLDIKNLRTDKSVIGVHYDEKLDRKKINQQFQSLFNYLIDEANF